jgi:hypothetical protein
MFHCTVRKSKFSLRLCVLLSPHNCLLDSMDYGTPGDNSTPIPLSLSCLPHLAQLTVQIPIRFSWSMESCLPAAMRLLDTLPSPPTNLVLLVIRTDIATLLTTISLIRTGCLFIHFPTWTSFPALNFESVLEKLGHRSLRLSCSIH